MADNYLENKMEELRSGRLGAPRRRNVMASKPDGLVFPVKALRVLILAGNKKDIAEICEAFTAPGCRVAVASRQPASETDLAADHGLRYFAGSDAEATFTALIKAWRDVDAVVSLDDAMLDDYMPLLRHHAQNLPYPNANGCPVLRVGAHGIDRTELGEPECAKDITGLLPLLVTPAASAIRTIKLK